jgi:PEGA domain
MSRVGLSVVIAAVAGVSLTGCSSVVSSNSSSEQLQALKFESDPAGAEIGTTKGQTCTTPCELSVPARAQLVTITKKNYLPQTVEVTLGPQPDHSFWENPPPTLAPNPVHVVLHPVSKPVHHVGGRKTHTAKAEPAPSAASSPSPPPPTQEPAASAVWPSPPKQ